MSRPNLPDSHGIIVWSCNMGQPSSARGDLVGEQFSTGCLASTDLRVHGTSHQVVLDVDAPFRNGSGKGFTHPRIGRRQGGAPIIVMVSHLVGDWNMNFSLLYIGKFIIRIDELIFFRGVGLNHQSVILC